MGCQLGYRQTKTSMNHRRNGQRVSFIGAWKVASTFILLFTALQSTQKRQDPTCFFTSNIGDENTNELGRITP
jgi:hypothetical protein